MSDTDFGGEVSTADDGSGSTYRMTDDRTKGYNGYAL
jgi:hypothetical protein